jgi:phage shock protein PspC (stress-responsive transcriptional regulator)
MRVQTLLIVSFYTYSMSMFCGSDSCYDDTICVLLLTCSSALRTSLHIAVSVVPWTVLLYLIFSSSMGPQTGHELSIAICMYRANNSFLMLGSYSIECELRRKWIEHFRLLLKMLFRRMDDDTMFVLLLLTTCSSALLTSLHIAVSVFIVPWTILLYLIFSFSMGPQTGHELSITICMYKAITSFLMLGSYRIECELGRKWSEHFTLLLQRLFRRMAGRTTDTNRMWKMAERITDVTCSPALLTLMRIGVSVFIVPWTILLYLIFSITMGPQTGRELSITICMYKSINSFLMLGSYRIECELRRKWSQGFGCRSNWRGLRTPTGCGKWRSGSQMSFGHSGGKLVCRPAKIEFRL